jgi:hypothetical protein
MLLACKRLIVRGTRAILTFLIWKNIWPGCSKLSCATPTDTAYRKRGPRERAPEWGEVNMELIRLDVSFTADPENPQDHRQEEFGIEKLEDGLPEYSKLRVDFKRFGRGEQRRSDFAVEMSWIDVQGFVRAFVEMGQPDALYLQRVIRLAEAIQRAGWSPDDPPTEDFWEIVPPQSN